MKTDNLIQLFALRAEQKAIEARIKEISDAATQEALAIAPNGGEFYDELGQRYQLQRTEVFDMADYHRYKDEDAQRWRSLNAQRNFAKKTATADTIQMDAITKAFRDKHPDWEPDQIKLTIKCFTN